MKSLIIFFIIGLFLFETNAFALIVGQVDTFSDETLEGWGGGSSPVNITNGGPLDAGDNYLQIASLNSNLAMRNEIQWSGDYLSVGIDAIAMDLCNFGFNQLDVHIMLISNTGGNFRSSNPMTLNSDSGWHSVKFVLASPDLAYIGGGGTQSLTDTLEDVDRLWIGHLPGVEITATLGIDNIAAAPEPCTLALLGLGILLMQPSRK